LLGDYLIGIEPMTFFMPWNVSNRK
jgi:hypothetical protein